MVCASCDASTHSPPLPSRDHCTRGSTQGSHSRCSRRVKPRDDLQASLACVCMQTLPPSAPPPPAGTHTMPCHHGHGHAAPPWLGPAHASPVSLPPTAPTPCVAAMDSDQSTTGCAEVKQQLGHLPPPRPGPVAGAPGCRHQGTANVARRAAITRHARRPPAWYQPACAGPVLPTAQDSTRSTQFMDTTNLREGRESLGPAAAAQGSQLCVQRAACAGTREGCATPRLWRRGAGRAVRSKSNARSAAGARCNPQQRTGVPGVAGGPTSCL